VGREDLVVDDGGVPERGRGLEYAGLEVRAARELDRVRPDHELVGGVAREAPLDLPVDGALVVGAQLGDRRRPAGLERAGAVEDLPERVADLVELLGGVVLDDPPRPGRWGPRCRRPSCGRRRSRSGSRLGRLADLLGRLADGEREHVGVDGVGAVLPVDAGVAELLGVLVVVRKPAFVPGGEGVRRHPPERVLLLRGDRVHCVVAEEAGPVAVGREHLLVLVAPVDCRACFAYALAPV
jgi:hypothetical protein